MFVKSIIFALVTLVISSHGVPLRHSALEGPFFGGSSSLSAGALASGAQYGGGAILGSGPLNPQGFSTTFVANSGFVRGVSSPTGEVV